MELRCANCGALLTRPVAPATTVRCHFCGAEQLLANQPAPDPRKHRPAPGAPAPSIDSAGSRVGSTLAAVVAIGGICLGIYATLASNHIIPSVTGFDARKLPSVSLRATPEEMTKVTGAGVNDSLRMDVSLRNCPYNAVTLAWAKNHTDHVSGFTFYRSTPAPDLAATLQRLQASLGRRLVRGETFSWGSAYLNVGPTVLGVGTNATIDVASLDDKDWPKRIDVLWAVALNALGLDVSVSADDRRSWLGGGWPLSALASLDMDTDVDGARALMEKTFPGAPSQVVGGLTYRVPIDHPWFSQVTFEWPNEKGGHVRWVRIDGPPGANALPNQAEVEKCVAATYGPGQVRSTDHLAGQYATTFKPDEGEIEVDSSSVEVTLRSLRSEHLSRDTWKQTGVAPPMQHPAWEKAMQTLDACGRR